MIRQLISYMPGAHKRGMMNSLVDQRNDFTQFQGQVFGLTNLW